MRPTPPGCTRTGAPGVYRDSTWLICPCLPRAKGLPMTSASDTPAPAQVSDVDTQSAHLGYPNARRGRPLSWVAVALMITAFATGGVALTLWNWPLFWGSTAAFLAAGILALAGGIMRDVH